MKSHKNDNESQADGWQTLAKEKDHVPGFEPTARQREGSDEQTDSSSPLRAFYLMLNELLP